MARSSSRSTRASAACCAGVALHGLHALTGFGGPRVDRLISEGLYDLLMALAVAICLRNLRRHPREWRAWSLIAAGITASLLGDLAYSAGLGDPSGQPTVCDLAYFAFYPLVLVGCVRLVATGHGQRPVTSWLHAAGAALAVSAAGTSFGLREVFVADGGRGLAALTAFGYPALDLTLVAVVVGLAAAQGWRLEPRWLVLGGGLLLGGVADAVYYRQITAGTYVEGGLLDTAWPAAMLLMAHASSLRPGHRPRPHAPTLFLPGVLGLVALSVLVADHVRSAPTLAIVLACGALAAVLAQALLAFRENDALVERLRVEALTDGLTGLANRRALTRRLQSLADEDAPFTLLLYDLDGFKLYNDTFGHPAGDALLVRLAERLREAVDPGAGDAYRMGGDEFCVLLPGDHPSAPRAELALRERGKGFDVTASFGAVAVPREAGDPTEALRVADQRLYAGKERRRASAGAQTSDALVRVLDEREPELCDHLDGVAALAAAVAAELRLERDAAEEVRQAAQLHDIGKVALPDLILHKPGPLHAEEWRFVRQHTLIGERILAAAPALAGVALLVRSSHERWDGAGYPDGLTGTAIPLGARIVAACDALDAMTHERAYRAAVDEDAALAELERCAGGQFDPAVVAALVAVVRRPPQPRGLSSRSSSPT